MAENQEIAIGREDAEFALTVRLVGRSVNVGFWESVELRLQLGVKGIHVVDINVVSEASVAGRRTIFAAILKKSNAGGFALNVSVVGKVQPNLEAEDVAEEGDGFSISGTCMNGVMRMKAMANTVCQSISLSVNRLSAISCQRSVI